MNPGSPVEEIKSRLDIVDHISDYVALKRAGANYRGLCPFHAEKTPSFMVSREKQIFHCFGCGAGGDVVGFTMMHENLTFPEALRLLARKAGVALREESPRKRGEREGLKAVQAAAASFFAENLRRARPALEYLEKRGVTEGSVAAFSLGFAPAGWHNLYNHLRKKGLDEALIMKSGLVARGNRGPYDIFRGRLMFPIRDLHGDVVAFGGRVIEAGPDSEKQPKYLNSPETELFHKGSTLYALDRARAAMRREGRAMVVEGYLDAIMCHQHGLEWAVAPLGTALTAGHLRVLQRYAPEVVLLFDGDQAGLAAARRSLPAVFEQGLRARLLALPAGEDPDSLLRKKGPGHLRALLESSASAVEFLLSTSEGPREETMGEAVALIARVSDPVVKGRLVSELSDLTRTGERFIREKLDLLGKASPAPGGGGARGRALAYNEEVLLLSAAIHAPDRVGDILSELDLEDIGDPGIRSIFTRMKEGGGAAVSPAEAARGEEEGALVRRLSLEPGFDVAEAGRNVEDCLRAMRKRRINEKIRGIEERLRQAESSGDSALRRRLLSERQKLLQEA
ncbi:MAG: DNA primase [Thermodesulfovibrionales bacterium]